MIWNAYKSVEVKQLTLAVVTWLIHPILLYRDITSFYSSRFSYTSEECVCILSLFSSVQPSVTPWTVACQAPLPLGFSRQEYWSGLPCPPPGDLPNPGIQPMSLMSPALAGRFFITSTTWGPHISRTGPVHFLKLWEQSTNPCHVVLYRRFHSFHSCLANVFFQAM